MSRKQYVPHQGSHQKKTTRKERKKELAENPIVNNEAPILVTAPDESDKKQLRNLTIFAVAGLFLLLILMYFVFVSQ